MLAPAADPELAGQFVQMVLPVMPVYVPVEQAVHTLTPAAEYVPVAHFWQVAEVPIPVPEL